MGLYGSAGEAFFSDSMRVHRDLPGDAKTMPVAAGSALEDRRCVTDKRGVETGFV